MDQLRLAEVELHASAEPESGSTELTASDYQLCPQPRHPPPGSLQADAAVCSGRFVLFKKASKKVHIELDGTRLVAQDQDKKVVWSENVANAKVIHLSKKSNSLILKTGSSSRRLDISRDAFNMWKSTFDMASNYAFSHFYQLGLQIGQGRFATVHKGLCLASGDTVAIKRVCKAADDEANRQKLMLDREQEVLRAVAHPNMTEVLDVFDEEDALYVVMQFMKGGSVADHLIQVRKVNEQQTCRILRSVLLALKALHGKSYVHRDVKPDNILIETTIDGNIKLADFGLSCSLDKSKRSVCRATVGSPSYMAPEMIKKQRYGRKVDIWACGVIMHALLTGRLPFIHHDPKHLRKLIEKGTVAYPDRDWRGLSPETKVALQALLTVNPDKRPSAAKALKLAFFAR